MAGHQLGFESLVAIIGVVVDLDAELLLELLDLLHVDVVGPVGDVQDLLGILRMRGTRAKSGNGRKDGQRESKRHRSWPIRESPHRTPPFSAWLERPVVTPRWLPGLMPERI